jgi:hypothetical protein
MRTAELIKAEKPDVLMVGGPPFYLEGFKVDSAQVQRGLENLQGIVEVVPVTVVEHHALRDAQWQKRVAPLYDAAAQAEHRLVTAAEFAGVENVFLESKRKQLYVEFPPSKEFQKWVRLDSKELSHVKPPL